VNANKRMKGVSVEKPIIYGSSALWLGKKSEETKTHKWTCYVRGIDNTDMSYFVKKVIFSLHPSFENPSWKNSLLNLQSMVGANSKL